MKKPTKGEIDKKLKKLKEAKEKDAIDAARRDVVEMCYKVELRDDEPKDDKDDAPELKVMCYEIMPPDDDDRDRDPAGSLSFGGESVAENARINELETRLLEIIEHELSLAELKAETEAELEAIKAAAVKRRIARALDDEAKGKKGGGK